MLKVTLFSRKVCHLCDEAETALQALGDRFPHELVIIDIDGDQALEAAYGIDIPVVEVGPYILKAPFNERDLAMTLGAAQDREKQLTSVGDQGYQKRLERGRNISGADRFAWWFSKRYMLVFNLFVLIYVGLPVLAPVFQRAGITAPANAIYWAYSGLCHQLSYRSFFIFGEQPIYPRAAADIDGYQTFNEATGLDENTLIPARQFVGNDQVGYKLALCQRDMAIYGAMLFFGVLFVLTGRQIKALPWWIWVLLGLFPIGLDGGSQLVGMFVSAFEGSFWETLAQFFPPRESTPFLRVLTGFLFGFTTAWFGYPLVEETMVETRLMLTKKFAHVNRGAESVER
ncbi:MAG: DUF2085 domain-containing protein [Anaerolineales bacterium]|nr:DUF2085 domain-containing protein [Anaerolineales bacterium]